MIKNVFAKWKMKRWKSDIYIYNDSRRVICWIRFSSKDKPVWMIGYAYHGNAFTVHWARNRPNSCLGWFLDEDNVKIVINLEYSVDNEVVLSNILREYLQVFYNHITLLFTTEWIEFFQLSWILVYSLECHSLLNLYFQNEYSIKLA